jgi:hypothetical protein
MCLQIIDNNLITTNEKTKEEGPIVKVERCKKTVQILKRNESNIIEIKFVDIEKKMKPKEEKIDSYIKSMCRNRV